MMLLSIRCGAIIKRFVTKQCNPALKRDDKDFEKHVDYIHHNPVKHGLVKQALDWPYSTFHRYVKNGVMVLIGRGFPLKSALLT